jgi:7,8-dihydropterin-6-yl-methyl-4-(beta-D-ribofuranosyl)aminobenzene 5'-phosphate synthase
MMEGWEPDVLIAKHGFSALITVRTGKRTQRILFDTGTSPDGAVENMRRLDIDPGSIEGIVLSHGHFDHTAGLAGLIRTLKPANMPVIVHPHFWRRRRVMLPGLPEPREIPTTSHRALADAGFEILDTAHPTCWPPARCW